MFILGVTTVGLCSQSNLEWAIFCVSFISFGFFFSAICFSFLSHCFPPPFLNPFITSVCFKDIHTVSRRSCHPVFLILSFLSVPPSLSLSQPAKVCLYSFLSQSFDCYCLILFSEYSAWNTLQHWSPTLLNKASSCSSSIHFFLLRHLSEIQHSSSANDTGTSV